MTRSPMSKWHFKLEAQRQIGTHDCKICYMYKEALLLERTFVLMHLPAFWLPSILHVHEADSDKYFRNGALLIIDLIPRNAPAAVRVTKKQKSSVQQHQTQDTQNAVFVRLIPGLLLWLGSDVTSLKLQMLPPIHTKRHELHVHQ